MNSFKKTVIWLTIFSIAMGYLESAVVVYIREIYYPDGFQFPLVLIDNYIAITELFREAATIIMLIGIGVLVGKTKLERFAWFIYCFAVWDIFYYVFLKAILNWPESFLTWDVLFLIPVTWVGPVITPLIVSFTMILLAVLIIYSEQKFSDVKIIKREWLLLILGCLVLIISFTCDYTQFIIQEYSNSETSITSVTTFLFDASMKYIPTVFPWWIFILGEIIVLFGVLSFYRRYPIYST
ncbi:MAG: hypothetical protein COC01_06060 [Bacteroidetes bacterium]|nr:MAG: hypothetical protein COC01_06060 [Bacteroidota bacterium]